MTEAPNASYGDYCGYHTHLLRYADEFGRHVEIRTYECNVAQLRSKTLLGFQTTDGMCLTVDATKDCGARRVASEIRR